jgi:tRNA A37 methylthiotransferase MiaB
MNVYIETFGCTFNQADSQIMAGLLHENGVKLVNNPQEADAIIINTCYVKHPTEQKVINRIQSLQVKFPDKKLLIAGCMVEIDPDKLRKTAPNASWISPHQITSISKAVKSIMEFAVTAAPDLPGVNYRVTLVNLYIPKQRIQLMKVVLKYN